jgi:DNA-binding HxlR family transcriptional regulator
MASYGEYCPIAIGVDVLGDRWSPLVLRELMIGCRRFNEIHRGLPKMNRTLLSQRLRSLERRGLVERVPGAQGTHREYRLTAAGRGLEPILWALGQWAAEWAFGDPADDQVDGELLVWRLHQHVVDAKIPDTRTVVEVDLTGVGATTAWLVLDRGGSTACVIDPGYEVDLVVVGDNRQLHRWLLGIATFKELQAAGDVRVIGPSRLVRAFPGWFDHSLFAEGLSARKRARRTEAVVI